VHDTCDDIYASLEATIGYCFHDRTLLEEALTHRSRANEIQAEVDNQRLEFFGDSILGFLISQLLFRRFPAAREGELTQMRASLVDEARLSAIAAAIDLGSYLKLGRGEARSGGREKKSILADAFEALLAAIYLDGGINAAGAVIERYFSGIMGGFAAIGAQSSDFKTELQEYTQAQSAATPHYQLTAAEGPDHDRLYTFAVIVNGSTVGTGEGKSKKEAQQAAARSALATLKR
jgi:ribonuclease-3